MTEEQVATAIAVLNAYADGTLRTNLCDELDAAIGKAYDVLLSEKAGDDNDLYSNYGYSSPQEDE